MTSPESYRPGPVAEMPSPRRLRRVHLAVAAVSALAGAAVVVAALLLAGWREVPVSRYEVRVFFTDEATPAQKESVRAALDEPPFDGAGRLLTREEALALARESYAARGNPLPDTIKADSMSEMAVVAVTGRDLDCGPFASLKGRPGVRSFSVIQKRDETVLIAGELC